MGAIAVVFNFSFCILTIFNDSCSGITVTIFDGYCVSTVTVVFNFSFCIFTIFNDSGCSITVTIFDGYCVGTVAVVFHICFSVLTVCTSITFRTCCTSITFRTSRTIFKNSGCGITVTIFNGYCMSAIAVVFNFSFCILTIFNNC